MISVIARNKPEAQQNRYSAVTRVATRFWESFAPFICGLELFKDDPHIVRIWIETDIDDSSLEGFMTMLTAFINPWTGGQNTVEVLKDDYKKYGPPRLKG